MQTKKTVFQLVAGVFCYARENARLTQPVALALNTPWKTKALSLKLVHLPQAALGAPNNISLRENHWLLLYSDHSRPSVHSHCCLEVGSCPTSSLGIFRLKFK